MMSKSKIEKAVRALSNDELEYRLNQCDKIENDQVYRDDANVFIRKKLKRELSTTAMLNASRAVREVVVAEIARRKN